VCGDARHVQWSVTSTPPTTTPRTHHEPKRQKYTSKAWTESSYNRVNVLIIIIIRCEAISRSVLPLWLFTRTVYPTLGRGPPSLWHPCHGRSGGSRWWVVHWHVSTPAKAGHHPSSWYRFGGSGLPVHNFEVWQRDQRDPIFVYKRCRKRRTSQNDAKPHR